MIQLITTMQTERWKALGAFLSAAALLLGSAAFAHGGEDHDDEPAATPLISTGSRAALQGEFAEAVLVPGDRELELWLDETDSNAPLNADLQVQIDGTELALHREGDGLFHAELAAPLTAGTHTIVLTVLAGEQAELLNGELLIPEPETEAAHGTLSAWWALLLVLPLLALAFVVYGRRGRGRALPAIALVAMSGLLLTAPSPAQAHGGEDHDDEPAALSRVTGDAPKRLPDGSLFVPKSSQRLLNVRTERVQIGEHAMSVRLNGQVIADPNGSGLIQAPQQGRILPAGKRLPALGSPVRAGETLALLEPILSQSERATLTGELARVDAALAAAEKRLERLRTIQGSVSRREFDQADVELTGLRAQAKAMRESLHAKLPLQAPVSGVVSAINVIAGAQVDAGATVLEIVSSNALVVEAAAFDDRYLRAVQSAVFVRDGQEYPLRLLGAGRKLRDQAIPVQFQLLADKPGTLRELSIGSIGTVLVASAEQQRGASVPQSALLRGDDGRPQLLIKLAPEQFKLVTVESEPLPDNRALIRSGLHGNERVVTSGASLLQQIR